MVGLVFLRLCLVGVFFDGCLDRKCLEVEERCFVEDGNDVDGQRGWLIAAGTWEWA